MQNGSLRLELDDALLGAAELLLKLTKLGSKRGAHETSAFHELTTHAGSDALGPSLVRVVPSIRRRCSSSWAHGEASHATWDRILYARPPAFFNEPAEDPCPPDQPEPTGAEASFNDSGHKKVTAGLFRARPSEADLKVGQCEGGDLNPYGVTR